MLSTPRPQGRGKRRPDRGGGIAKRPRMEESSSDRRDESEESRSGGTRDRPGRGGRRAAGPSTPPHQPPTPSVSPRRSPRLTKSAAGTYGAYPLPPKVTGGRPIPDRSVGMSTDGGLVARHGVRRTTDDQARGGGPDPESPRRHS